MYNVLLVEDEDMVRRAIAGIIKWEEIGFTLAGQARNGEEAIEIIEKQPIHLVLTDICMPFMDGLDLAAYIHENKPETKVVIISGYDEFDYAKRAVTYNVSKYILKPLTSEELTEELINIRKILDDNRISDQYIKKLEMDYRASRELMKERFLTQLLEETLSEDDIQEELKDLEINIGEDHHAVALLRITNVDEVKTVFGHTYGRLITFATMNIMEEILRELHMPFTLHQQGRYTFSLIFSKDTYESKDSFYRKIEVSLEEVIKKLHTFMNANCATGVGTLKEKLVLLNTSFEEAVQALEYSQFIMDQSVVFYSDIHHPSQRDTKRADYYNKHIFHALVNGDELGIESAINNYLQHIQEHHHNLFDMRTRIIGLTVTLTQDIEGYLNEDYSLMKSISTFISTLNDYKNIESMGEALRSLFHHIMKEVKHQRSNEKQHLTERICQMIEKSYHDDNLNLSTVSDQLFLSSSYLGKLFKQEMGENFKNYLTRIRMEYAKEMLLNTELKTYEIARKVGYKDPHYFSYSFKKYTGVTTKSYRNKGGALA